MEILTVMLTLDMIKTNILVFLCTVHGLNTCWKWKMIEPRYDVPSQFLIAAFYKQAQVLWFCGFVFYPRKQPAARRSALSAPDKSILLIL